MSDKPITTEYALDQLGKCLQRKNYAKAEEWKVIIRSNEDMRLRARARRREMREMNLRHQEMLQYRIHG